MAPSGAFNATRIFAIAGRACATARVAIIQFALGSSVLERREIERLEN